MAGNPIGGGAAYLGDLAQRDAESRLRVLAIGDRQRAAMSRGDDGANSRAPRQIAGSHDPEISHAARRPIGQIGQIGEQSAGN